MKDVFSALRGFLRWEVWVGLAGFGLFVVAVIGWSSTLLRCLAVQQEDAVAVLSRWVELLEELCSEGGGEKERICQETLEERVLMKLYFAWSLPLEAFPSERLCFVLEHLRKRRFDKEAPYASTYVALWLTTWEEQSCPP